MQAPPDLINHLSSEPDDVEGIKHREHSSDARLVTQTADPGDERQPRSPARRGQAAALAQTHSIATSTPTTGEAAIVQAQQTSLPANEIADRLSGAPGRGKVRPRATQVLAERRHAGP